MTMSEISASTKDSIHIRDYDLVKDLMGHRSFVDVTFLQISGRMPEPAESRMLEAILVTVSDHGLTPSVLAARLTNYGAPEALQASVAAGLLGAGNRILGAMQNASERLRDEVVERGLDDPDADFNAAAEAICESVRAGSPRIPGYGHPIHVDSDPRVERLIEIAEECGFRGPHLRLAEAIGEVLSRPGPRRLPMNAASAIGGIIADMDQPPILARGLSLIGRAAGLVAHLLEETENPIARDLWGFAEPSLTR